MRPGPAGPFVFALALAACGAPTRQPAWTTVVRASNPLVGKVYDERTHALASMDDVDHAASRARFVLLGEKHDNPDHHRLQAEVLRAIASRRLPLVFEMIDVDLQPALDAYLATGNATADGLRAAVQWDSRGWPPFDFYRPIFDVALRAREKLIAGGLPHDVIKRVVHEGVGGLPPEIAAHVHIHALAPALATELDAEIKESHCGFLPEALVPAMSLAQRVKDAFMADLMASQPLGAVLVAGNGHVRTDRGVPFELAALAPGAAIASVSFVEVNASTNTSAYVTDQPSTFLAFTPRVDDEDPCAKFRSR